MQKNEHDKLAAKAAYRELPLRQKLEHIWIYFKWPILLGLAALIIVGAVTKRVLTKKDPVLYLAYINTAVGSELDEALGPGYLDWAGADPKKQEVLIYRELYLSEDAGLITHETAYASRLKTMAAIESHQLDLVLVSREAWDMLSASGYLLPLDEALQETPALKKRLAPYLMENEIILEDNAIEVQLGEAERYEAVTETAFNAVDLSACPRIRAAGFDEPVYLAVIANTPRLATCLDYLQYLFAE